MRPDVRLSRASNCRHCRHARRQTYRARHLFPCGPRISVAWRRPCRSCIWSCPDHTRLLRLPLAGVVAWDACQLFPRDTALIAAAHPAAP